MITKAMCVIFTVAAGLAGAGAEGSDCAVDSVADGQIASLRGRVVNAPHDMTLEVPGCKDSIVLVSAGSSGPLGAGTRNRDLQHFWKYTSATRKRIGNAVCMQCPRFRVEATLTGRLAIATVPGGTTRDSLGFLHDSSGRIVGRAGFGHPVPVYKFQMEIESASDVVAHEIR